ncbi:hypothetical protein CD201_09970 [Hafnia alvei]|nr:hypothetical protein CD201_09970 [Hafnia alvei]KKI45297.1 hypothetical protein XK86_09515 [Hafnia alvei]RLR10951.1 hypothetical protein EAE69_05100 [Hafnia alvei ATCC 13337]
MRHSLVLRTFKNNELSKKQNDCGISAERRIKNFDKKVTKVEFYSTKNRRNRGYSQPDAGERMQPTQLWFQYESPQSHWNHSKAANE